MKPTYADAVALRRAKAGWTRAGVSQTGSHLGHPIQAVGVGAPDGRKNSRELIEGPSVDGSVAYRQFQKSNNPYDPIFLKNSPTGTATVGPLQQVESGDGEQPSAKKGGAASPLAQPASSSGELPQNH